MKRQKKRALLSVTDKTGLVAFATGLLELGYELVSTGGTAVALRDAGLPVTDVAKVTRAPEGLEGRIKTLHPRIFAGILALLKPSHQTFLDRLRIKRINLVVGNLYDFMGTISKPGISFDECVEKIDIGGPSAIRAAGKNYKVCPAVVDIDDYPRVLAELQASSDGTLSPYTLRLLQLKVFKLTSEYDTAIYTYLAQEMANDFPPIGSAVN